MEFIPDFDASAASIWIAYGLAFLLLGGAVLVTVRRLFSARRKLEMLEKRDES